MLGDQSSPCCRYRAVVTVHRSCPFALRALVISLDQGTTGGSPQAGLPKRRRDVLHLGHEGERRGAERD